VRRKILGVASGLEEVPELSGALGIAHDEDQLAHIDEVVSVHLIKTMIDWFGFI
jgi:hypothetical protein